MLTPRRNKKNLAADRKALKVAIREIKLEVVWKISCSSVEFTKLFCTLLPLRRLSALSPSCLPPLTPSIRIRSTANRGKNARQKTLTEDRLPSSLSGLKRVTRRCKTFCRTVFRNSLGQHMVDATRRVNRLHSRGKKKTPDWICWNYPGKGQMYLRYKTKRASSTLGSRSPPQLGNLISI